MICTNCLKACNVRLEFPLQRGSNAFGQKLRCPLCRQESQSWVDTQLEVQPEEREMSVRLRVMNILSQDRLSFVNTPQYNNFLEEREDTIIELAFGENPKKKEEIESKLKELEVEKHQEILDQHQRALKRQEETIQNIVNREGLFYEKVKKADGHFNKKLPHLEHQLAKEFPDLFQTSQSVQAAIEAAIAASSLTGYELIQNIVNNALPNVLSAPPQKAKPGVPEGSINVFRRQPASYLSNEEIPKMMEAGGYRRSTQLKRMKQELFGGFRFQGSKRGLA